MTEMSREAAALAYAELGWPVLPLAGKIPRVRDWPALADSPASAATIRGWWRQWPTANLGVACGGRLRLAVLDADSAPEAEGVGGMLRGVLGVPLVRTPRGGAHFWFRAPDALRVPSKVRLLGRPLDVRGWGGLVAVPPSVGSNGARYQWADGSTVAPPPDEVPTLPAAVVALLQAADALPREGTTARDRRYPLRPALLAAALANLRNATRATNGSVSCSCPAPGHDDAHPSAVIYPDGTLRCFSACDRLWAPQEWTRWPTVAAWAAPLVRGRASTVPGATDRSRAGTLPPPTGDAPDARGPVTGGGT
jgi:hypothetical protein